MSPLREELMTEIKLALGDGMVDVELDPAHLDLAIKQTLEVYRQRSNNAMEESFIFLEVQPDVSTYTLPDEVQEVRDIYRRSIGATAGGGASIDPFSLAFTNNIYLLTNPGGLGGGTGILAQYELAMGYQELIGRMFGRDLMFTWNAATKKLFVHRRFTSDEEVVLHVYMTKTEDVLLRDPYAKPWIRAYATACAKIMLGEAYSKFSSLAGPQGGISLKGDALKTEGAAEKEKLEAELLQFIDSHDGMPFIIG